MDPLTAIPNDAEDSPEHIVANFPRIVAMNPWNGIQNPTSRLSPDILLNIFMLLRDTHSDRKSKKWDWMTVTKICRYWRTVALDCPGLWSEINNFIYPDKIRTFLDRSAQAELKVQMDCKTFDDACSRFTLLRDHTWRVRELKFSGAQECLECIVLHLSRYSRRLKTLELRFNYYQVDDALRLYHLLKVTPGTLPDSIPLIQLDSLHLYVYYLPWSNSLYHGLTTLCITCRIREETPTVWQFMDILERCPALQHLQLKSSFRPLFIDVDISEIEKRKVTLRHLKSLVLDRIPLAEYGLFIAMLNISENVSLDLTLASYDFSNPQPLPSNILIGRGTCRSLFISFDLRALVVSSKRELSTDSSASDTTISLDLPGIYKHDEIISGLYSLLSHSSWHTADSVIIEFKCYQNGTDTRMSARMWTAFLDKLPKFTKKLEIRLSPRYIELPVNLERHEHDYHFHDAISEPCANGAVRLPELESLTICYLDFPPSFVEARKRIFFRKMQERCNQSKRPCNFCFVDRKRSSAETVMSEMKTEHTFTFAADTDLHEREGHLYDIN